MNRATVKKIAQLANVDPKTVRRYADLGRIEANRDVNGWRIFPNPERAVETVRRLLLGQAISDDSQKATATPGI